MLVKICGLTRAEDAKLADQEGADFLGMIFAKSPRQISAEQAKAIVSAVGSSEKFVAVFVNESLPVIQSLLTRLNLKWVQLHGDESPEIALSLKDLGYRVIKAVRVASRLDIEEARNYPADYLLLDTHLPNYYGGTGKTFDWQLVKKAAGLPTYFLSGGLTLENITKAIHEIKPPGVDASSGLEASPGIKDPNKLKIFFEKIRGSVHA